MYYSSPPATAKCLDATRSYIAQQADFRATERATGSPPSANLPNITECVSQEVYVSPPPIRAPVSVASNLTASGTQNSTTTAHDSGSVSHRFATALGHRLRTIGKDDVAQDLERRLKDVETVHELTNEELATFAEEIAPVSGPLTRSSNSSSSSSSSRANWRKNRTNAEKEADLVSATTIWEATQAMNQCNEGCGGTVTCAGRKEGKATFEAIQKVRACMKALEPGARRDAMKAPLSAAPDQGKVPVHVQDADFSADLCTSCFGSVYGVPKSTVYTWRADAREGKRAGSGERTIRDRVEGMKALFVNMFLTFFVATFGTAQKSLQNCDEMHPDSVYKETPEVMLMDRYSASTLLEEYMLWRDMTNDEAPLVSDTYISILWKARLASEVPFPILVRMQPPLPDVCVCSN